VKTIDEMTEREIMRAAAFYRRLLGKANNAAWNRSQYNRYHAALMKRRRIRIEEIRTLTGDVK